MATVNRASLNMKLNLFLKYGGVMNKYGDIIASKGREIAEKAGDAMVECVHNAITSSGLTGGAIAAIGNASKDSVAETGRTGNTITFKVGVSVDQQSRPSLDPGRYGSVMDMAALFNNGYIAGGVVRGEWHGMMIDSLTHRPPTYFAEHAVDMFNSMYGAAYNATAELTSDRFD